MIYLPQDEKQREEFWKNHVFTRLSYYLTKMGYAVNPHATSISLGHASNITLTVSIPAPLTPPPSVWNTMINIQVKFRPDRSVFHYSLSTNCGSYAVQKGSRRFRWKNPSLKTLCDSIEYLRIRITDDTRADELARIDKQEKQQKKEAEVNEIAKALNFSIDSLSYGAFVFSFKINGQDLAVKFRLADDGDVRDFEIEGVLKKHHFLSIIDSLKKSAPDYKTNGFVKKRRIDLSSDIVTRMAKNENIKNFEFSKIRSWKRNFSL
jgi:hypothetical protein